MTKVELRQVGQEVADPSQDVEVATLREHVADLRAENSRLQEELQVRRREVASLHAMLGQMMRGPWVYVDDDRSPRWA